MSAAVNGDVLLRIDALKVAYGGIQAVKGLSLEVRRGELVSLIGANGAGKTTTLKAVTGLQPAVAGTIEFLGRSIRGRGPWDLAREGLVMVPEGRGTFARMSIVENLQMGAYVRTDAEVADDMERMFALFPRLKERRGQLAGTLSGGEQQMLAMARALMARPHLRGHRRHPPPRHHDAAGRAERRARAAARRPRLRDGLRRADDERRGAVAARRPGGEGGLPRGVARFSRRAWVCGRRGAPSRPRSGHEPATQARHYVPCLSASDVNASA